MKFKYFIALFLSISVAALLYIFIPRQPVVSSGRMVVGGIVPHHLLVRHIIIDFFAHLPSDYTNIVILGPNHEELGSEPIITSSKFLLSQDLRTSLGLSQSIVDSDQSIKSLMPFITKKYPGAQVIPIIFKHSTSFLDLVSLSKDLIQLPGKTLVIASIDFSHYQNTAQAEQNDQVTLNLLKNHDYQKILGLNSDYLDSPPSLVTALLYFKQIGADGPEILVHTNSGLLANYFADTTSYFSMLYHSGAQAQVVSASIPTATPTPSVAPVDTTIIFTGDVMLGRSVNLAIATSHDPSWPFQFVASELRQADLTYANLESPLVVGCPQTDRGMKFCGDPGNAQGLASAGIDLVSLANNHTTNYAALGLSDTITTLSNYDIKSIGTGQPAIFVRNGTRFGFLSFNDIGKYQGISSSDEQSITSQIQALHPQVDVVITTFHWGVEYQSQPSTRQISFAHLAVEAGADLVIGAHPHWVQPSELYQGKYIYYSLGNFVFDQEWSQATKSGLAIRAHFSGSQLTSIDELPVLIKDYGQPHWQN